MALFILYHYNSVFERIELKLAICCLLMFMLIQSASAQKDTVNLKEVEVIGLKPEISTSSPNPVQEINIKRLNSLPATTVADAIRNFSGVTIKDFGGIGGLKTVMIRSMGANHTAVFVDGLPNHDAATGQIDLGRISLQDVGKITLSVGQPEFGLMTARMYASATVLDIKSKDPDFKNKKTLYNLSLRAGSYNSFSSSISVDRKWSKRTTTGIRLSHYLSSGKFPYEVHNGNYVEEKTRQNSDISSTDVNIKSNTIFKDSSSMNIKASWYHSERGLPGAVIFYNPYSVQRLENNDLISGLQFKTNPRRKFRMLVSGGLSRNSLLYRDPNFQNQTGGINNKYNQHELYFSDAVSYKLSSTLIGSVASDIIYNSLNTNAYSVGNPTRLSSLTVGALHWITETTELQASMLFTAIRDASDKTEIISNRNEIKRYSKVLPALSIMQSLTKNKDFKARVSIKQAQRMPSFNDLYYYLAGNVNIKPEDALMLDFGLLFNKSLGNLTGVNFRLNGFYNKVSNKIVVVPTQNLFIWSTRNIGKVNVSGIEVVGSMVKHLSKDWSFDMSGNYTYQNATDMTNKNDASYGDQIAYIPYETAAIIGTVYFRNLSSGVNVLYNGFRYTSNYNLPSNLLQSWITTDLTISWETHIRKNAIKVKGEVINLFNERYQVVRSFPMTGRSFYINLYLTI